MPNENKVGVLAMMPIKPGNKISVIMTLLNDKDEVLSTVDSILSQTCSVYEIILVDVGSTNGAPVCLEKLRGQDLKIIKGDHANYAEARNVGLKSAKGDFVVFVNSGDTWEPHFVEEMQKMFVNQPDALCYGSAYQYVFGKDRFVDPIIYGASSRKIYSMMDDYFSVAAKGSQPFIISSLCCERDSLLRLGGFREKSDFYSIYELISKVAIHYKIAYNANVLVFRSQDKGGVNTVPESVLELESFFSQTLMELASGPSVNESLRNSMSEYTSVSILRLVTLNMRLGRIDNAKKLLDDKLCKRNTLAYYGCLANYWLSRQLVPRRSLALL